MVHEECGASTQHLQVKFLWYTIDLSGPKYGHCMIINIVGYYGLLMIKWAIVSSIAKELINVHKNVACSAWIYSLEYKRMYSRVTTLT